MKDKNNYHFAGEGEINKRICFLLNDIMGTITCSAFVTAKKVCDNMPTLMASSFLVNTIASFPRRIDPDLNPFPYNPTGTWPFIVTLSLKPKLKYIGLKNEIKEEKWLYSMLFQ